MSELILEWLNKDVGLSKRVKVFERDFASGYLFGELLHKSGLLEHFEDSFADAGDAAAARRNWAELQKALQGSAGGLGIRLKEEQVTEIMNKDRGSSLRLLYQIRKGLQKLSEPPPIRATKRVDSTRRLPEGQEPIEPYAEFFQNSTLKTMKIADPRVRHEINAKDFVDEQFRQLQVAAQNDAREKDSLRKKQSDFRTGRLEVHANRQADKERALKEGMEHWQDSVERNTRLAEKDLEFEKQTIAKDRARLQRIHDYYVQDCGYSKDEELHGIGWFEHNLQRFGIDPKGGREVVKPGFVEATGAKELQAKLPTTTQKKVDSAQMMKKIQQTQRANDQARKERVRRNHREALNRAREEAEQAAVEEEDQLLMRVLQESADRRAEALAHDQQQRRKEAAREQRLERQQVVAARRERESEEASERTAQKARAERAVLLADRAAEKEREEERRRLRVASGLNTPPKAELDEYSSDEDEDDELGAEEGLLPLPGSDDQMSISRRRSSVRQSMSQSQELRPPPMPVSELLACARDTHVSEFVFMRGSWAPHRTPKADALAWMASHCGAEDLAEEDAWQSRLGGIVRGLVAPETSPPPASSAVQLASDFMPVLMLGGSPGLQATDDGRPLAAALAHRLREDFDLAVVDPHRVALECLELARGAQEQQEPEWPILARLREIGQDILQLREQQEAEPSEPASSVVVPMPPALYAEMIFRKIELLASPPPKAAEVEDPKAKKKPAPKKDAKNGSGKAAEDESEAARPKGVVVLGFPVDLAQFSAWEAALRGYVPPLLRAMDGEGDRQLQISSVLAPWWLEQGGLEASALELLQAPRVPALLAKEQPATQVVRLRSADSQALRKSVLAQAENAFFAEEEAAPAPAPGKGQKGGEAAPAEPEELVRCQGCDEDLARRTAAVDRAWLYHSAQVLADALTAPTGGQRDVFLPGLPNISEEEDDGAAEPPEPLEEVCYKQVRELVLTWRPLRTSSPDQLPPSRQGSKRPGSKAPSRAGSKAPAKQNKQDVAPMSALAPQPTNEDGPIESILVVVPDVEEPPAAPDMQELDAPLAQSGLRWEALEADARARLRKSWLEAVEDYLSGTRESLSSMRKSPTGFAERVVRMQRQFLDFLQGPDQKGAVLDEFVEAWPQTRMRLSPEQAEEELDELSDQLWQVTDRRRAEAVEERFRYMEGGFWEEEATACLRLVEVQYMLEAARFHIAVKLLAEAFGVEELSTEALEAPHVQPPEGLSSLPEFAEWLLGATASFAGGDMAQVCGVADGDKDAARTELCQALRAEQLDLVRRLRAVEGWAKMRLKVMRRQLNDVFARMDDWIKSRVAAENGAIRATLDLMHTTNWDDPELGGGVSPKGSSHGSNRGSGMSMGRRGSINSSKKSSSMRKVRRELHKALQPRTLDVAIGNPEEDPNMGTAAVARITPPVVGTGGSPDWWTLDMLRGLMACLAKKAGGRGAAPEAVVLEVLLERRNVTNSFESDLMPQAWALRSEETLAALCQSLACSAWGAMQVDLTEFMLTLTMHSRQMTWPSLDALEASRASLEEQLPDEQRSAWPDVPVSEAAFLRLPFLEEMLQGARKGSKGAQGERPEATKRWLFNVLLGFEPGAGAQDVGAPATVSARRVFTYFCLGEAPTDGLQRSLRLLMPPLLLPQSKAQEELPSDAPQQVRVLELWRLLFARAGRADGVVAVAPELANFVKALLNPGREASPTPEPAAGAKKGSAAKAKSAPKAKADAKAKARPGSQHKQARSPTPSGEEGDEPPPPPEEAMVAMAEKTLLRHPQLVKGLCSHGALHCHKARAVAALFPLESGTALASVLSSEEASAVVRLQSLVPAPLAAESEAPAEEQPEE